MDWAKREALGPQQFTLNLRLVLALTREIGAELILCRQVRLESGSGTTGVSVEEYSMRNTHLTLPELERAYAISNAILTSLPAEVGLELVDMHTALKSDPRYFHDGIHFSPEGSRAASVFVADIIQNRLRNVSDHKKPNSDEQQKQ